MANLTELLSDPKRELRIKQRQVALQFGIEVECLMKASGLKRIELAKRLDKSRSWVSKLLFGPRNLKLFTAVEVADVLDADVELRIVPRQCEFRIRPMVTGLLVIPSVHAEVQAMAQFGVAVPSPDTTQVRSTATTIRLQVC